MNSRELLLGKLNEMRRPLNIRESLAIEIVADETELTRALADRDLEAARFNMCSANIKEILDAIARLDGGEYGICIECEEAISAKRIAALPWAKRCIRCQESFDAGTMFGEDTYAGGGQIAA